MREKELVAKLRQRDETAMEALLTRYTPLIRYVIAPILNDPREQEECIADVAMRIWEKAASFDLKKGSLTTWLTVISRNAALNRLRDRRWQNQTEALEEQMADPGPGPEEYLLQKERIQLLQQAVEELLPGEKNLFYRKYYYRQSTAQIAAELGMTERAVEGRLYRIRKQLKKRLGGELYDQA